MGLITTALCGIGAFVLAVLGAATANQLAQEFRGWTPWLTNKLIERALKKLPSDLQPRYREEWMSFIADIPGQAVQIIRAFGLRRAASIMTLERVAGRSYSRLERVTSRVLGLAAVAVLLPAFIVRRLPLPFEIAQTMQTILSQAEYDTLRIARGARVLSWSEWRTGLVAAVKDLLTVRRWDR
jgi:hypothetical protein